MMTERKKILLATLALVGANVIGSFAGYASKMALRELPPMTILFFRISVMVMVFFPFIHHSLHHLWEHRKRLFILGILWVGNVALFIVAIQYTTVFISSILYAFVPIAVLFLQSLLFSTRTTACERLGVSVGFAGAILTIVNSYHDATGTGTLKGALLLSVAVMSWASYLIASKRFNVHVAPVGLTFGSSLVAWFIVGSIMLATEGYDGIVSIFSMSGTGFAWLLYIAFGVGVGMIFLQLGLTHSYPLVAGSMLYLSMAISSATGIVLLGEPVTPLLILGTIAMLFGVFLVSILPLIRKDRVYRLR